MDHHTLLAYNRNAATYSCGYRSTTPAGIYRLIQRYFAQAQPTADIGCGSGRDVAWLEAHGYPTTGYDASPAMLAEARHAYPTLDVREATLPNLETIPSNAYTNVLCCAVLMHLPHSDMAPALANLARIMCPGGQLVLSYLAATATERRADGRLYTALSADALHELLGQVGIHIYETELQEDATRAGVQWWSIVGSTRCNTHRHEANTGAMPQTPVFLGG